jgi:hypothetical protein
VLILGRFSEERKIVLDAIRDELCKHNYLPILFDFSPSPNRDTVETVRTLAGMSRFIIADLTDAKSVLQELQAIVPDFPSVAVRFLILGSIPNLCGFALSLSFHAASVFWLRIKHTRAVRID